jgi:O-antigen/teichoic acid export membrane protein
MAKTKKIRSDVVRDSINTFGTNAIGTALMLVASIVVLRKVKPEIKGYYTSVQTWGSGFYTILSLSIAASVIYFVARYKTRNTKRTVVRLTGAVFLGIGVVGSLVLFLLRKASMFQFDTMPPSFLVATVVYALCSLVLSICTSVLRGENKFKSYNIVNLTQRVCLTALYCVVAVYPSADLWIWGTNGIMVVMTALALFGIRRWSGPKPQPTPENDRPVGAGEMTVYSLKAHVSNILSYFNTYLGTYIVQGKFKIENLGIYNTAFTIVQQVWILPEAVSQVIMSRIAAMSEEKDKLRLTLISAKVVFYITAVVALLVLWMAYLFVPWLFPMYAGAVEPLAYLIVGSIFISYSKVLGNSIAAYGRPELNIIPTIVGIVSNFIASFLFIPLLNINGVALATSASFTLQAFTNIAIFCVYSHTPAYRLFLPTREELAAVKSAIRR